MFSFVGKGDRKSGSREKSVNEHSPEGMSIGEHLRELRNRLLIVFFVFLAAFLCAMPFSAGLTNLLLALGKNQGYSFIYLAPQELLLVQLGVALFTAFVVALPCLVYHAYGFCAPALEKNEKRGLALSIVLGFVFFFLGVLFALRLSLPFMLGFLIQFTNWLDVSANISVSEYIRFITTVFLIFGVIFELPVISLLLSRLGLIRAKMLIKARKIMIVVIFIVAAVITPPDVVSQVMVAFPMVLLYELSILVCRLFEKKPKG